MSSQGRRDGPPAGPEASEFIACVAEELRIPLTAVLGYLELLSRSDVAEDEEWRTSVLRSLRTHAQELYDLSEALASASCAAEGPAEMGPVDACELVAQCATAFAQGAPGGVFADIDPATPKVGGDARTLRAALDGLLRMVSWGADAGAVVQMDVHGEDDRVEIAVAAPGNGKRATEKDRPRLGEWIARRVAESLGGSLRVDAAAHSATLVLPAYSGA